MAVNVPKGIARVLETAVTPVSAAYRRKIADGRADDVHHHARDCTVTRNDRAFVQYGPPWCGPSDVREDGTTVADVTDPVRRCRCGVA